MRVQSWDRRGRFSLAARAGRGYDPHQYTPGELHSPEQVCMDPTPASLLERLRDGGAVAAWGRFVDLYTPFLYHCTRRLGLRPEDAADLVQDVFAVLVRKLPEFEYDRDRSFRAWLRTVVVNKWRETLRRRAALPAGAAGPIPDDIVVPDDNDAFTEAEYRQHLIGRALRLMQGEFQPTTWRACWEHVVSGRSAAEVGAELGISEGAVYVAKHRVLRRLREELQGLLD
ncbi:MAG TPA: sigma-70 family RNA polymerase sigma factor [Gemmataceae bacterium]|nr:sigma-70 family RNA polymerase sigma factor [Gemmataceae bacterium]